MTDNMVIAIISMACSFFLLGLQIGLLLPRKKEKVEEKEIEEIPWRTPEIETIKKEQKVSLKKRPNDYYPPI